MLELRLLGWNAHSDQAADLADIVHNLPAVLYSERFSWESARTDLECYADQHPESGGKYLALFDAIER